MVITRATSSFLYATFSDRMAEMQAHELTEILQRAQSLVKRMSPAQWRSQRVMSGHAIFLFYTLYKPRNAHFEI